MSFAYVIPEIGGPDVMARTSRDVPSPGPGEILVHNHATAVNFIDTIIRRGEMPEGMMPALPHIPGVEGAGVIEKLGDGVDGFAPGDKVAWVGPLGASGYGSHSVISSHGVTKLAEGIDFNVAASLPVNALTAWHMLVNLGRVQKGETILVHAAAGGVGTMILHIAQHLGVKTIASVSTGKVAYARAQGATEVIDYRREDLGKRVMELTGREGVNLTLNPVAGESIVTDMEVLAPLGTAILFGFLSGPPVASFEKDLTQHFGKSIAVRVSDLYTYYFNRQEIFAGDMKTVFALLEQGILRPQIDVMALDEAANAHRKLEAGDVMGKLVLSLENT